MWPFLPLQSFSGLRLTTEMQLAFEVNRTNFRNSFGLMSLVCTPAQWEAIPRIHSVNFQWDVTRQAIKQRLSYVQGQACLHRYRPCLRPLRNKSAHAPTACPSRRVPIPRCCSPHWRKSVRNCVRQNTSLSAPYRPKSRTPSDERWSIAIGWERITSSWWSSVTEDGRNM